MPDAKRIEKLEAEKIQPKKLPDERMFQDDVIKDALRKFVLRALAQRAQVRDLVAKKFSEQRARVAVRMGAWRSGTSAMTSG